jgi:hypothetical protein
MAKAKAQQKRKASGCGTLIVLIVIVVVVIAVVANKSSTPSAPKGPFTATNAQMAAAVANAVDSDGDAASVKGSPTANCTHGSGGISCYVSYTVNEPAGISAALELIDPTRGFFKTAFSDASVNYLSATVSGPATSVGGKTSTTPLFTLACNRNAANQIDWDNVGVSGLKTLCTYTAHVSGLNN